MTDDFGFMEIISWFIPKIIQHSVAAVAMYPDYATIAIVVISVPFFSAKFKII